MVGVHRRMRGFDGFDLNSLLAASLGGMTTSNQAWSVGYGCTNCLCGDVESLIPLPLM